MPKLSSHVNVWDTCIAVLDRRGYTLRVRLDPNDEGRDHWVALRGTFELIADTPIELLGLAAIHDEVRPPENAPSYWWAITSAGPDAQSLRQEAHDERTLREIELAKLRTEHPDVWEAKIRDALAASGVPSDAAYALGISTEIMRVFLADPRLRRR